MQWLVYIIHCSDNSLYTGISTNVAKRFQQHASQKGAKYFRSCHPLQLVYLEAGHSRSSASRREAAIKKLNRQQKQQLIATYKSLDEITLGDQIDEIG
ncbi:GIY-YIG nuclease family protein [Methylomonas paludis]|uniref:GIY-YIG nuclease family protein n=1 Tax=Methylomonas paludis TaxID=1173101 RepID=A0A975R9J9_9GAMM|nr:GIY-YIG nuclease family protein [Methylomonas paludis]QWF70368.1 GIY-YIG nuclease family protein [Methylomonas paludis]